MGRGLHCTWPCPGCQRGSDPRPLASTVSTLREPRHHFGTVAPLRLLGFFSTSPFRSRPRFCSFSGSPASKRANRASSCISSSDTHRTENMRHIWELVGLITLIIIARYDLDRKPATSMRKRGTPGKASSFFGLMRPGRTMADGQGPTLRHLSSVKQGAYGLASMRAARISGSAQLDRGVDGWYPQLRDERVRYLHCLVSCDRSEVALVAYRLWRDRIRRPVRSGGE
jgi:hypothetical protein